MEFRRLGKSGLSVPVLSLGAGTFGGSNEFFKHWGATGVEEATRLVDICLESGLNFFDTADIYSDGDSERILGQALKGRRDKAIIATKGTFPMGEGPNARGSSRHHILKACEDSLTRLETDYVDVYFMHGFDGLTPVEETLRALDDLTRQGKVRYIGCSNFSGWHLMKSLAVSERESLERYVVYQGNYSLISRDFEWELMPLCLDQGVGLMVWSPLGWGRLTGRVKRGQPLPEGRLKSGRGEGAPPVTEELLYAVTDALEEVARETGRTVAQIALNWLLQRPSVVNLVIGARNEQQLRDNLGAADWTLDPAHVTRLEDVSRKQPPYPYWHQMDFEDINPKPVKW